MKEAIIRLIVLVVMVLNQLLITFDKSPFPFSEDQVFTAVSSVAMVLTILWNWWKNNNVTKEAQKADEYMHELKRSRK